MSSVANSSEGSAEWHYEQAVRLLSDDTYVPPGEWDDAEAARNIATAQVHATLAGYKWQQEQQSPCDAPMPGALSRCSLQRGHGRRHVALSLDNSFMGGWS